MLSQKSWYVSPSDQIARARQLWPDAFLPAPPLTFAPQTPSEVPLLHVPDEFDSLWGKIVAPEGYRKQRWEGFKTDVLNLRIAPGKWEIYEPAWVAFDPEHGKGKSPDSFWGAPNIAASEVFSAVIQFPDWPLSWNESPAPNMAGYQINRRGFWGVDVPRLDCWGGGSLLRLLAAGDDLRQSRSDFSSPSVRKC